jgi:hypothetical protein
MSRFDPAAIIRALNQPKDYSIPKGWSTIEQIRQELNLAHARNASTRARDLWQRGLLERMPHQTKAFTGQCHMAYVYRPKKPWRNFRQAAENYFTVAEEKVPAGWVRIMDYSADIRISHVALRARVARQNLRPRYFKTSRGIVGLHRNAYYRKADLDRLLRKAT